MLAEINKYANIHAIYLSYNNDAVKFRLPVNPEAIEVKQSGNGKTYDIVGGGKNEIPGESDAAGEINVIKSPSLMEVSFKGLFPANDSPLVIQGVELWEPMKYVNMIRGWMHSKYPMRFLYVGHFSEYTGETNTSYNDINIPASIESFEWKEVAGAPGDIEYAITLKEYRFYSARKYDVFHDENGQVVLYKRMPDRLDERVRPETYTLKPGESLVDMAIRFFNQDSSMWKYIQEYNGLTTDQVGDLTAGTVLRVPPL